MKIYPAVGVLSMVLSWSTFVQTMPIPQFDQMDRYNRIMYETNLFEGAAAGLKANGQPDQAKKLRALFRTHGENGGVAQLEKNLQIARDMNKKNSADPNNKQAPYEVENAMLVTLQENGFSVPLTVLFAINKNFKPSRL
jgi:hypothetical protein